MHTYLYRHYWLLTISIIHLGPQVRLHKEAGKAGGHVVAAVSAGVLLQGKGVHQIIVPAE